jgi:hypothetical protein
MKLSLPRLRSSGMQNNRVMPVRIPADRGHQFRRIVGSDSGPSWAPIPVHRGQL